MFDANGGIGTMEGGTVENDGGYSGIYYLPECAFTAPDGKKFDHWEVSCEPDEEKQPGDYFTAPYTYDESYVETITVTAIWRDYKTFTVTLPEQMEIVCGTDANGSLTYETIADGDKTTGNVVPSGTAVMLQTAPTDEPQQHVLMLSAPSPTAINGNLLHGGDTETTTTGDGKHYKLSYNTSGTDLGWYWGTTDGAPFTSGAHKVWLVLPSNNARAFFGLLDFSEASSLNEELKMKNEEFYRHRVVHSRRQAAQRLANGEGNLCE